jgi:hypothetical protein
MRSVLTVKAQFTATYFTYFAMGLHILQTHPLVPTRVFVAKLAHYQNFQSNFLVIFSQYFVSSPESRGSKKSHKFGIV